MSVDINSWQDFLLGHHLERAEFAVLSSVKLGPYSPNYLVDHAVWIGETNPRYTVSREEANRAINSLIKKRLVQMVDDRVISVIRRELDSSPAFGPIRLVPQSGVIDLTKKGARLLLLTAAQRTKLFAA